jgi:hypothetical protein
MPAGRRKRTGGDPTARPRPHGEPGGPDVRNTRLVFAPRLRHARGYSPAGVGNLSLPQRPVERLGKPTTRQHELRLEHSSAAPPLARSEAQALTAKRPFCDGHHIAGLATAPVSLIRHGRFHMRNIRIFVIATAALILTAGIGGWIVITTSDVRAAAQAANPNDFGGRSPIRGGLAVLPPVY